MADRHESLFSYAVTRQYPFRWFTWVVVIVAPIATALFSLISFAANGFESQTIFTSDPNATLADSKWYQRPSMAWISKVRATCEPQLVGVENSYFTSNMGFAYRVEKISPWSKNNSAVLQYLPSLPYLNNTLQDCQVTGINMEMEQQNQNYKANWKAFTWEVTEATASIQCKITGFSGQSLVTMSLDLPQIDSFSTPTLCLDQYRNVSSLWWGCQLVNYWYAEVASALQMYSMDVSFNESLPNFVTGSIGLLRRDQTTDIKSLDFFQCNYWFTQDSGKGSGPNTGQPHYTLGEWIRTDAEPTIGTFFDIFGKSLYSLILADLGQPGLFNGLSNIEDLYYLASYNASQGTFNISADGMLLNDISKPVNVTRGYDYFKENITPPIVYPATLLMQYACSVPVRKDTGSVIVSILIGDLVFLQALWTVFSWLTGKWLAYRYPDCNVCTGCAATRIKQQGYEAVRERPADGLSGYSETIMPEEEFDQQQAFIRKKQSAIWPSEENDQQKVFIQKEGSNASRTARSLSLAES